MSQARSTRSSSRGKDLTGLVLGDLTVIACIGSEIRYGKTFRMWRCKCACGKEVDYPAGWIQRGELRGCGCRRRGKPKHGHARKDAEHPLYVLWVGMRSRCNNPCSRQYSDYGGRGITVCDRWQGSFAAFLADMGPRPSPSHSLDRESNNGNYEPGNCRWATRSEQNYNRRDTIWISLNDERLHLKEACEAVGLSAPSIQTIACRDKQPHQAVFDRLLARNLERARRQQTVRER